jgi:hypothetical protein
LLSITDNGESFESGSLTGLGLFLDGLDFHDFFLKFFWEECFNDFLFLDWDGESEYIDDVFDEFSFNKSTEFGDWFPFVFVTFSVSVISWFSISGLISSLFVSGSTESSFLLSFSLGDYWSLLLLFSH